MDPAAPGALQTNPNPLLGPMMPGSVLSITLADQAAPKPLQASIFVLWAPAGVRQPIRFALWAAPGRPQMLQAETTTDLASASLQVCISVGLRLRQCI